ncbi:hypothetical protein [Candidatus Phycosocius spiralis]|nr:hypothetical protein [Candidatus Phycosocius spiralis]
MDFEQAFSASIGEAGFPARDIVRLLTTLTNKQRIAIELVKIKE